MRTLFILLLSCLPCFAQFSVEQPIFQSPSGPQSLDLLLPSGMMFRWVHTNLSSTPVSVWTDVISSSSMVQTTAGKQPAWDSSTGVHFDGTDWFSLTNVTMRCGTGVNRLDCFLLVINWDNVAGEHYILDNGAAPLVGSTSTPKYYNASGEMGPVIKSTWVDYLYAGAANDTTAVYYTNGVSMASGAFFLANMGNGYVGRFSGAETVNYQGYLKEFIIWTNTVSFTTTQVSNIHYYSVQKWGAYNP